MHATASYKAIHMAEDDTDYSAEMSSEDVIQALTQLEYPWMERNLSRKSR